MTSKSQLKRFKASKYADLLKRVEAARDFPRNTCPASRHLQIMAENLLKDGRDAMLEDEPEHCAETMLAVVAALYEARTMLAKLDPKP